MFDPVIYQEQFFTIERDFGCENKFRQLLLCFKRISQLHDVMKRLMYNMINLRHFCKN